MALRAVAALEGRTVARRIAEMITGPAPDMGNDSRFRRPDHVGRPDR